MPDIIERLQDYPIHWLIFMDLASRAEAERSHWERLDRRMSRAQAQFSFVGRQTDVRLAYERCDVVMCPSLQESFGRIVAEAMVNALPVVASDIEPFRDLLLHGDAGILFPPGDTQAAADAVARLCSDSELRQRLGRAGQAQSSRYDPVTIAEHFATLYQRPTAR